MTNQDAVVLDRRIDDLLLQARGLAVSVAERTRILPRYLMGVGSPRELVEAIG